MKKDQEEERALWGFDFKREGEVEERRDIGEILVFLELRCFWRLEVRLKQPK